MDLSPISIVSPGIVGSVVRATRKSQNLRIDDAASNFGVSVDLMSRLENGQGTVRMDKVLGVLDGLGLVLVVMSKDDPVALKATAQAATELPATGKKGRGPAKKGPGSA